MCISRCDDGGLIVEEGCVVQIRVVRCAQDLEAVRPISTWPSPGSLSELESVDWDLRLEFVVEGATEDEATHLLSCPKST